MEQEKIEVKSNKHSYGKYLLIFAFLAAMFGSLEQNIKPQSLSALSAFFITFVRIILDTSVTYFLVLWIADLIRRRGKVERPENKKVKLIINIIFAVIFLGMVISVLMVLFKPTTNQLNPQQSSSLSELNEKNQEFITLNNEAKTATQYLLNVLDAQEWTEMKGALQKVLSATQALQPKINEMKAFAEENSQLFTSEQEKQAAIFYGKAMEVRDRHNKKLIELITLGLQIDWNNPDEAKLNQWTKIAGELSEIEKEIQSTQLEFQKVFQGL
jgi:amino acid transporter